MAKITKKSMCWKPKPIYISWSAVTSLNKPFHLSLKIQFSYISSLYFGTLFSVPHTANPNSFTCMNNELAKYLCTFYNQIASHPNNTVILPLK